MHDTPHIIAKDGCELFVLLKVKQFSLRNFTVSYMATRVAQFFLCLLEACMPSIIRAAEGN